MQEKILNGKKNGMAMLLLFILLYAAAIAAVVFGAVLLEGESYLAGGNLACGGPDSLCRTEGFKAAGSFGSDFVWQVCGHA